MATTRGTRHFINMAAFLPHSESNGPGARAVLWVQGCPIRCPGCFNAEFIPFRERTLIGIPDIADIILSLEHIEGVTFTGGEPFAQAGALARLGRILQVAGKNIVTFTGYGYEDLARDPSNGDAAALLEVTDLLVAGPYSPEERKTLHFLTPELQGRVPDPENLFGTAEYLIRQDGTVITTGFPSSAVPGCRETGFAPVPGGR
ncbi:MAG: 4Fe-4S single cluster domain-containing protein [Methanoregulaceae archaeon]